MLQNDFGLLILRLALGILILLHGIAKLLHGIGGIEGMLANAGLPTALAYGVYIGEIVAPLMVVLGFHARLGGVIIALNMLFAIGLAHAHQLFQLTSHGGWQLELQGMYLVTAIAIALLGPGGFSINRR
ncbi:MAG: DoxX family protein [Gammaproteobacteria bacterium]|nr:DoxX family protein [Gammaproteobacteria bacterium]